MRISILIPCYNEEKSIKRCVESCLTQSRKPDEIVVVNDGSTDRSPQILKKFGKKIKLINVFPASGNKSYAQEIGLKKVTGEVFVSTDGDTIVDKDFVKNIEKDFTDKTVAAVCGCVKSIEYNWLTAYRAYDYTISQNLHKLAQSYLGFILVIPGAAGAFRKEIFDECIGFDHDTLTEDLDFTYKLNRKGLKIKYDREAIVYTQDPTTLKIYINQMRRWFGGGWQNLAKYLDQRLISEPGRSLELSLIYIEGLVFSLTLFILPVINIILAFKFMLMFYVVVIIQGIYAAIKEKRWDILLVPIYYPMMMYINAWVSIEQFINEFILAKRNMIWYHPERVKI